MKAYLFSFNWGIGDEFPICYHLVYAIDEKSARIKLKQKLFNKLYNIECCTTE